MIKKIVIVAMVFALFACYEDDYEVERGEANNKFTFSIKNDRNSDVTVGVKIMAKYSDKWEGTDRSELTICSGKSDEISLSVPIYEDSTICAWSFLIGIEGENYLGFPKTDERGDLRILASSIVADSLHWVKMAWNTSNPEFCGDVSPTEIEGLCDGKKYFGIAEHFSITIGDEVDITLDKVEF